MRLDSWKAIADYLKRDVATVRRWEKLGLPVRRVPGGRGSSVFAFRNEIDQWLADGGPKRTPAVATIDEAPTAMMPEAPAPLPRAASLRSWIRPLRWLVAAAPIVAGVIVWARVSSASIEDLQVVLTPDAVIARSIGHSEIWRHEFPKDHRTLLSPVGGQPRMLFGNPPAIFAMTAYSIQLSNEVSESGRLLRLDRQGQLEREFAFDDSYRFGGKDFGAPWAMTTFAVDDATGTRRVAVAAHHYIFDPGLVTILDSEFTRFGTFVHAGWIEALRWLGPSRLVAAGYSNQELGGMITLLDPAKIDGQGPAAEATPHFCQNCGPNRPLAMVVMPRSEVNLAANARFNRVVLDSMHGHLLARTIEVARDGEEPADAIYEFDEALNLVSARWSERYWVVHRQLEATGALTHAREQCPDRDGPRTIRTWTPAAGWQTQSIATSSR